MQKYTRNSDGLVFVIQGEEKGKVVLVSKSDWLPNEERISMKPELFRQRYTPVGETYAATADALAPSFVAIRDRIVESLTKQIKAMYEQLTKDEFDAEKSFAFPMSNMSRFNYLRQKEAHHFMNRWTEGLKGCRSFKEPNIRKIFSDEIVAERVLRQANNEARAVIGAYVHKLTAKEDELRSVRGIPAKVTRAEYSGALWSHSTMKFFLDDGTVHVWNTHIILNVSCLGKLFNQFPTRLIA